MSEVSQASLPQIHSSSVFLSSSSRRAMRRHWAVSTSWALAREDKVGGGGVIHMRWAGADRLPRAA